MKNNLVYSSPVVIYSCLLRCYPYITVIDRSPNDVKEGPENVHLS